MVKFINLDIHKKLSLWGSYMTDIIVGYVDPNANTTMEYLRHNPNLFLKMSKDLRKK